MAAAGSEFHNSLSRPGQYHWKGESSTWRDVLKWLNRISKTASKGIKSDTRKSRARLFI
jgi:hypothetical protein